MSTLSLCFCLLLLSLASSKPHQAVRSFASGLVTGFAGRNTTLPASCFDLETSIALEDALIDTLSLYIRGSDGFQSTYRSLHRKVRAAVSECHFTRYFPVLRDENWRRDLLKVTINTLWSTAEEDQLLSRAVESVDDYQWLDCGTAIGQFFKAKTTRSVSTNVVTQEFLSFAKGAILGLASKQVDSHPCVDQFQRVSKYFGPLLEGAFTLTIEGDRAQMDRVMEVLEEYAEEVVVECRLSELRAHISAELEDADETVARIVVSKKAIVKNVNKAEKLCSEGLWEECGRSWGKAAKLILGWEL